jgi:hypothetical protein
MATFALPGGSGAPAFTGSWVGWRGLKQTITTPAGDNVDVNGNRPILITRARAYTSGHNASRSIRFEIGGYNTDFFTVASSAAAQLTPYQTINAYYANSGSREFRIKNSATDAYIKYGSTAPNGPIYAINASNGITSTIQTGRGLNGNLEYFSVPSAPQSATTSISGTNITVSWSGPASNGGTGVTDYRFEWSADNANWNASNTGGATSVSFTGAENTTYYFRIACYNAVTNVGGTYSQYSNTASRFIPIQAVPPTQPQSPAVIQVVDTLKAGFSWSAPSDDGGADVQGYQVQYATNSAFTTGLATIDLGVTTAYTSPDLTVGLSYSFRVRAYNISGYGAWSNTVSVNIAPLFVEPDAPEAVGISQLPTFLGARVTWSPPEDDGGSPVTGYRIQFANNPSFTGATLTEVGNVLLFDFFGLTESVTYYARVAAANPAGYSPYSDAVSVTILPLNAPLDNWKSFGTRPATTTNLNSFSGVVRKVITDIPTAALSLHIEVDAVETTGTITAGQAGITRMVTGLTVGKQYRLEGRAVLTNDSALVKKYRLSVLSLGSGSSVTLSGTTLLQTIPAYIFTATSTSHFISIEVADSYTITETGPFERVAFNQIELTEVGTDSPYRVQDTVYTSTLANHFDLVTRSVGASWWVDKLNKTRFGLSFDYAPLVAEFSDVIDLGLLNYTDIKLGLKTKDVVNDVLIRNKGDKVNPQSPRDRLEFLTNYPVISQDSIDLWGARRLAIETNLWTESLITNLVQNPSFQYGKEGVFKFDDADTFSLNRVRINTAATGVSNFMPIGTTAPVSGDWALVMTAISNKSSYEVAFGAEGQDDSEAEQLGFPIKPDTSYTASLYWLAGIDNVEPSTTTQVWMRWYDANGNAISNSSFSAALAMSDEDWVRNSVTATSPSNAYYAQVRTRVSHSHASPVGRSGYMANVQLNEGALTGYIDGDIADDDVFLYEWLGVPGQSESRQLNNILDEKAAEILDKYSEPINQVSSILWNAQQDTTAATLLDIGSRIRITLKESTESYRVISLKHNVTPERWIIEIGVQKL